MLGQAKDLEITQTLNMEIDVTYELSVAPLLDASGKMQGTIVVCRDVSERRQALSQLADTQ